MAKKIFGLFVAGLLAASAAVVSACGPTGTDSGSDSGTSAGSEEEIVLSGCDVPEEATVSYGTIYTIPDYVVQDQNGTLYTVEYVVTSGGETVSVVGGQISIDSMEDYTITYTVQIDEDDMVQKTTVLKVMDENIPYVSMSGMRLSYLVGETIALPTVEVTEPGTLGATLGNDRFTIEQLAVSGTLDYEDLYLLGELSIDGSLRELDLREASLADDEVDGEIFYGANIERILLPTTVKRIGDCAFGECERLAEITLPASVETVEERAFEYCSGLTTVVIEGRPTFRNGVFRGCEKLTTLRLGSAEPVTLSGTDIEDYAENITVYVPAGSLAAYEEDDFWSQFKDVVEDAAETEEK